jgi:hypothetical protein
LIRFFDDIPVLKADHGGKAWTPSVTSVGGSAFFFRRVIIMFVVDVSGRDVSTTDFKTMTHSLLYKKGGKGKFALIIN